MKVLVGIDTDCTYKAALRLCERLRLHNPTWTFAHAAETVPVFSGYGGIAETAYAVDFASLARDSGQLALHRAVSEAALGGLQVEPALLTGNASQVMMHFADENAIDLIAVHSERKGQLGSFFLGSVSRGLAISAKQSVLISKGDVSPTGPISAVFATDHSPYARCALRHLLEMAPAGLKNIHVLTAIHLGYGDPYFNTSQHITVEKKLVESAKHKVRQVAEELTEAGYYATGHVYNLPVDEAINRAMTNAGADLLILGAQGHGFLHRLSVGSTALHQVVVEPHSVLLLRPGHEG